MDKPRNFYKDTYHHVYNRCVGNLVLFRDSGDYKFFLRRMRRQKQRYSISLICYCLMPNHFHLFLKQLTEEYPISKFISGLKNSFTKAYNKKYNRTGVIFEAKVQSKHVKNSKYYSELVKYILLNPVRKGLVVQVEQWEYSSPKDYFGHRNGMLNNMDEILNQFESKSEFHNWVKGEGKFDTSVFY